MSEKKEIRYEKKEYRKQLIIAVCSFVAAPVFCAICKRVCIALFGCGPHDPAPVEFVVVGFGVAFCVLCVIFFIRAFSKVCKMNKDKYKSTWNRLPRR